MSQYNNIINIYDALVGVSDQMHEEHNTLEPGFNSCLFILHNALKNFEGINLHIENRNLRERVKTLESLEYEPPRIYDLNRKIKELSKQVVDLKNEIGSYKKAKCKMPVEILQEQDLINILENGFSNNDLIS